MGRKDKRIDAYIDKSEEFAKPILRFIRAAVHKACPDVQETMKWSMPHFDHNGIMCSMAAFKAHCVFGFWKTSLMKDPQRIMNKTGAGEAMGNFGRITSIKDLPKASVLVSYVKEAALLNEKGIKAVRKPAAPKKPLRIPAAFASALQKNKKAFEVFSQFNSSHKREYIEWIVEAKTDETRARRIATTIKWLSEGKSRNWKYVK